MRTGFQVWAELGEAHLMRVLPTSDYDAREFVAVCSCDYEHIPVTTRAEAEAEVAKGCPVELLDQQAARRRAARLAKAREAA